MGDSRESMSGFIGSLIQLPIAQERAANISSDYPSDTDDEEPDRPFGEEVLLANLNAVNASIASSLTPRSSLICSTNTCAQAQKTTAPDFTNCKYLRPGFQSRPAQARGAGLLAHVNMKPFKGYMLCDTHGLEKALTTLSVAIFLKRADAGPVVVGVPPSCAIW